MSKSRKINYNEQQEGYTPLEYNRNFAAEREEDEERERRQKDRDYDDNVDHLLYIPNPESHLLGGTLKSIKRQR